MLKTMSTLVFYIVWLPEVTEAQPGYVLGYVYTNSVLKRMLCYCFRFSKGILSLVWCKTYTHLRLRKQHQWKIISRSHFYQNACNKNDQNYWFSKWAFLFSIKNKKNLFLKIIRIKIWKLFRKKGNNPCF